MNTNNNTTIAIDRNREREIIAAQVKEFLDKGGKINVIKTSFELYKDPKCRLGDDAGFFR